MEKDYHLSNSKTDEAEHLESAAPQLQLHPNNTDNEAYKSYHGEGKVKEVANVRSRVEVSRARSDQSRNSAEIFTDRVTFFLCGRSSV